MPDSGPRARSYTARVGVPRLLFVTQLVDPEDPVLGFVVQQLEALTAVADVTVIANEVRAADALPARVISLGKERGASRLVRAGAYTRAVWRETQDRPAALVAHMCPIYLVAAAPITRLRRVPSVLWFVHPDRRPILRLAERLAGAVTTATSTSYPAAPRNLHVIGHAIDTAAFAGVPPPHEDDGPLRVLALGRTSPVKHLDTIIRGVAAARAGGTNLRLHLVGPSVTAEEREHRTALVALIAAIAPDAVTLDAPVDRSGVVDLLADTDVLVNATESGSGDKVVFEAMAAGRPVLASSTGFSGLLDGLPLPATFAAGDPRSLADALTRVAQASPAVRAQHGARLRARVEDAHSLHHWARELVAVVDELHDGTRSPEAA